MAPPSLRAEIFGFDSGWGCREYGTEDGPAALRADEILRRLALCGVTAKWRGAMGFKRLASRADMSDKDETLPFALETMRRLHTSALQAVENGSVPVVIGGDHSSAVGTWSAAAAGLDAQQEFGLIWLDAHMDAHTPATAHEGKWGGWWHGQPLSALMGYGRQEFTSIGGPRPKLAPKNITLIGCHSYEPGEYDFLKRHKVRIVLLDEVKKKGFEAVFAEALERATDGTKGFGLSVDLDCFQTKDAPGIGNPEGDGLVAAEVLPIITSLARKPGFAALEIAEYNPHNDVDFKTRLLIEDIVASVFAK